MNNHIMVKTNWQEIFQYGDHLANILKNYIPEQRWFRSKSKSIQSIVIREFIEIAKVSVPVYFVEIDMNYVCSARESYFIWFTIIQQCNIPPIAIIQNQYNVFGYLAEAIYVPDAMLTIYSLSIQNQRIKGRGCCLQVDACAIQIGKPLRASDIKLPDFDQTNSSIIYGDIAMMKLYRLNEQGINPEVELGILLTERQQAVTPLCMAVIRFVRNKKQSMVAFVQEFSPNQGTAYEHMVDIFKKYGAVVKCDNTGMFPWQRIEDPKSHRLPASMEKILSQLAHKTATMHLMLAKINHDSFEAETFTEMDLQILYQKLCNQLMKTSQLLKLSKHTVNFNAFLTLSETLNKLSSAGKKIRCHGDYHLGQILCTGKDFVVIDFEGEPGSILETRKIKHSPLKDIAGVLRSFHYALDTALNGKDISIIYSLVCQFFINEYLQIAGIKILLPDTLADLSILLRAYMLEKTLYEVAYEINNRPKFLEIPLRGLAYL